MSPPFSHDSAELLQDSSINPAPHDPPLGSLSLSRTKDCLWSSQTRFAGALALTQSTNAHGWSTAWWTQKFDESSTWTLHFYASMWMRVSHTHMDEEQHGGRKSSTNHPHELYIFMRPCGWEYYTRTWMKNSMMDEKVRRIIHMNFTFLCVHVDESITNAHRWRNSTVDDKFRRIICMDFTFVCIHADVRITNAYGWRNCVVDEIVRWNIHMELHFMHPCAWENHKRTWMKKYRVGCTNDESSTWT
jgi:hypothetical protein